jgi:protein-tyrosine phosphatase
MKRHIPLEGTFNVRDLGGYSTRSGQQTKWQMLYRADSLHNLSLTACETLLQLGITTIIDLRNPKEVVEFPTMFQTTSGINYIHIHLLEALEKRPSDEYVDNLATLYKNVLTYCSAAIASVMQHIALSQQPVLFHCTAGKDRTGIIAALLLDLVGVDLVKISEDYALTGQYIPTLLDQLRVQAQTVGYDLKRYEWLLESKSEAIETMLRYMYTTFGPAAEYLRAAGLTTKELEAIRSLLLGQSFTAPAVIPATK